MTVSLPLSAGSVYQLEDGTNARMHYISTYCLLYERLDENTHPYRIVRRIDGRLLGVYRLRGNAVAAWDQWFRDGSHA